MLYWFEDGLFVRAAPRANAALLGARICGNGQWNVAILRALIIVRAPLTFADYAAGRDPALIAAERLGR